MIRALTQSLSFAFQTTHFAGLNLFHFDSLLVFFLLKLENRNDHRAHVNPLIADNIWKIWTKLNYLWN